MSADRGRVVQTPSDAKPYKVVLEREHAADSEHPVSTIREGEDMIRHETPTPPKRDTSRDQPKPQ